MLESFFCKKWTWSLLCLYVLCIRRFFGFGWWWSWGRQEHSSIAGESLVIILILCAFTSSGCFNFCYVTIFIPHILSHFIQNNPLIKCNILCQLFWIGRLLQWLLTVRILVDQLQLYMSLVKRLEFPEDKFHWLHAFSIALMAHPLTKIVIRPKLFPVQKISYQFYLVLMSYFSKIIRLENLISHSELRMRKS